MGGVDNIEYGWSDSVLSTITASDQSSIHGGAFSSSLQTTSGTTGKFGSPGQSRPGSHSNASVMDVSNRTTQSTTQRPASSAGRVSIEYGPGGSLGHRGVGRLPGDRIAISDWRLPVASMMASQLMEVDQKNALTAYVSSVEEELKKHLELSHSIKRAVSSRAVFCVASFRQ